MLNQILPVYAAVLSTILAAIKVWEIYQNRFRVKVKFSSGYKEYSVLIANLSAKPIIVTYYGLFLIDSKKVRKEIETGSEEGCNFSVPANDRTVIRIKEQYHFSIKPDSKLYLTLNIVGRKTITKRLV